MRFRDAILAAGVMTVGVAGVTSKGGASTDNQEINRSGELAQLNLPSVEVLRLDPVEALIGKHNQESRIRAQAAQLENSFLPNAQKAIDRTNDQDRNWNNWSKEHQHGSEKYRYIYVNEIREDLKAQATNPNPEALINILGVIPHSVTPGYWAKAFVEQLTEIEKIYKNRERYLHPENTLDMEPNHFGEEHARFMDDGFFDLGLANGPDQALEFISRAKTEFAKFEARRAEREAEELAYKSRSAAMQQQQSGLDVVSLYEAGKELVETFSAGTDQKKP